MCQLKILISACLLGDNVRYNGKTISCVHSVLNKWGAENRIIRFCPEVEGGLPTPRPPAEIQNSLNGFAVLEKKASLLNIEKEDVTSQFILGAHKALKLVKQHNISVAVLKDKSPSCGSHWIHDGSFQNKIIAGMGVTAALLQKNGVFVFSEEELDLAEAKIQELEHINKTECKEH